MKKKNKLGRLPSRVSVDGQFVNQRIPKGLNYRVCRIGEHEVFVWGAGGCRALPSEVVSTLRTVVRRIAPELPIALMADHHPAEYGVVGSVEHEAA